MARSYYSVMLYHPADEVWTVIRPFDHYAWAGVESETIIEHGKAGDRVGAVRRVSFGGKVIRQVLLAHSDIERSYSYAFCGAPPFPVQDYVATIRVTPIVADGASFIEWWATFDCAAEDLRPLGEAFRAGGLCQMARRPSPLPVGRRRSRLPQIKSSNLPRLNCARGHCRQPRYGLAKSGLA